jgi:hypothetical protein
LAPLLYSTFSVFDATKVWLSDQIFVCTIVAKKTHFHLLTHPDKHSKTIFPSINPTKVAEKDVIFTFFAIPVLFVFHQMGESEHSKMTELIILF